MTKADAIRQIEVSLPALSAEQLQALAELAVGFARAAPQEDETTWAAIAEGLAQAERGELVAQSDVDQLLLRAWK